MRLLSRDLEGGSGTRVFVTEGSDALKVAVISPAGSGSKGIYEITGDSLKVCYDLKGQRYPKSFDVGPGSVQAVYEFRRP